MKKPKKSRGGRILKRILLTLFILLLLAGAVFYGYSMLKQEYTITYDSYSATTGSISNALSFSGNLNLVDNKTYSASSNATVRTVYVSVDDHVEAGDKLIRLSNGETVEADFAGRVNACYVEEGDSVSMGTNLIQVADFENMQVTLRIDEYDIADVSVGQRCTVTATATEQTFESEIATINYISSSGGSVAYYSAVAYVTVGEGVLPGMQVTISIPQQEATDVVILKADAISFDATNQAFVWMKNEAGELEQVFITTGVSNGNYVEITSGLSDGDEVFVEVEEEATSAVGGLLAGLFGGQQFNGGMGGGMPGMSGGSMPDFGSFDMSSMPDFSSMGGGSGGGGGGFSGGGGFGGGGGGFGGMPGGGQ